MYKERLVITALTALIIGAYVVKRKSKNKNVRNNNPLNIEKGADWKGLALVQSDKRFAQFKHHKYGFRAAYIILLQYLERGDNTIMHIVNKWAPSAEASNHTDNYIEYVASKVQTSPINVIEPRDLPLLMLHMADFEGAKGAYTIDDVIDGVKLAQEESFVIARMGRLGAQLGVFDYA